MPAKRTRILEYPIAPAPVFDAAFAACEALGDIPTGVEGTLMTTGTKMTWLSFGENVTLTVEATGPSTTRVTLLSASSVPTQIVDWGVHRRNLNKLQASMTQSLGHEPVVIQAG